MILGIGAEAGIFLYAVLAGVEVAAAYRILVCFRNLVVHSSWVMSLEDLIYWFGASVYIFRKMYETTYGGIRWFFVLGMLCGGAAGYAVMKTAVKWCAGICGKKEKNEKSGRKSNKEKRK